MCKECGCQKNDIAILTVKELVERSGEANGVDPIWDEMMSLDGQTIPISITALEQAQE